MKAWLNLICTCRELPKGKKLMWLELDLIEMFPEMPKIQYRLLSNAWET